MRNKFTKSAQKALDNSLGVAKSFGHGYIGTEHLLIALVKTKGVAADEWYYGKPGFTYVMT